MRTISRSTRYPVLLALALLFRPASVAAQAQSFPHGTVRLIAENTWIEPAHTVTLGLRFSLEDNWHMYWINPGDSGEPPGVTWELPQGLTSGPIQWPSPERLGSSTVVDYGYKGDVTLLVPMRATANFPSGQPLTITANVKLLVCKEICVPGKVEVALTLPVKTQPARPDPAERAVFAKARARQPQAAPAAWKLRAVEEKDSFVLSAQTGERVAQAYFYPLEESQIKNAPEQLITPDATGFRLALRKSEQLTRPVARLRGVLQLAGDRAYMVDAPVVPMGKGAVDRPAG